MTKRKSGEETLDLSSSVKSAAPDSKEDRFEQTTPYLSNIQLEEMTEESRRLRSMIDPSTPSYIRATVEDPGQIAKQLRQLDKQIETQMPRPYSPKEKDAAVKREKELRERIVQGGMATQAEMRKNPPGAVYKHMRHEQAHKDDILEWKNIRKRIHASDGVEGHISDKDIANIEVFRPQGGVGELSMDNAQIPGKTFYFPAGGPEVKQGLSDEEYELIRAEIKEEMKRQLSEGSRPQQED